MTEPKSEARGGRRGRAERAGRESAAASAAAQIQPRLPFSPVAAISADELEAIHVTSLMILEEIGMDFLHPESRNMLKSAGAAVDNDSERVRFDRGLIEQSLGLAPRQFILHARNPSRNVIIGGREVAFCSVASAPNAADRDGGRRPGTYVDFKNFIRLGQMLDSIHVWGGYPVEPADIHASVRHLDALYDMLTLSDKPIHAYSLGRVRNLDALEMVRIARGIDDATLEKEPSLF